MTPALIIELEALLTDDQRRLSVADHQAFRESLAMPQVDEIDLAVEELNEEKGERP